MYKLALMFVTFLFLICAPASAAGTSEDKWVVTQLSGDARVVHPGLQPASVKVNTQLGGGDTLLTGPTGRATLVRGSDYIVVAPRSELRLPSTLQPTGFTRVIQTLGTLLFKVQHTGIPHFAVDTPMLAAVVKGTTFTVVVDQQRSAVQVIQGVVQVSALDGGMSRMVEGGKTVFVNHAAPKVLLDADKAVPATTAPSSASVRVSTTGDAPLATVATLTGGLVRADLTVPQTTIVPAVRTVLATATPPPSPTATTAPNVTTSPTATAVGTTPGAAPVPTSTPAPTATIPSATTPSVTVPSVSVGSISTPTVTVSSVATPSATVPNVSVGSISTPTVTVASVTTPPVTVPSVSVGSVSTPAVTVPSVTTPSVTVPSVSVGSVSTPTVTVPSVTAPSVTVPSVSVGSVSTPTVTVPSITAPVLPMTTPTVTVPSISTPIITVPTLPKL